MLLNGFGILAAVDCMRHVVSYYKGIRKTVGLRRKYSADTEQLHKQEGTVFCCNSSMGVITETCWWEVSLKV